MGPECVMDVERDAEDPVGVLLDSTLKVVRVVPGTLADGNLNVGDTVVSINGNVLKTRDDYYQRLRFAQPRLRLVYRPEDAVTQRSSIREAPTLPNDASAKIVPAELAVGAGVEPSAELERIIRRRPGFKYLVFDFDLPANRDKGLGIVLSTIKHRVIVTGLKPGALGAEKLQRLDRFLAINAVLVSDKEVARALVAKLDGKFTVLVERPETEAAKAEHLPKAPRPRPAPAPAGVNYTDVGGDPRILPLDCLLITKMEREKKPVAPGPGILRGPPTAGLRSESKTSLAEGHQEHAIGCDTPAGKRLRPVGKR